jgi:hypothetical protein
MLMPLNQSMQVGAIATLDGRIMHADLITNKLGELSLSLVRNPLVAETNELTLSVTREMSRLGGDC